MDNFIESNFAYFVIGCIVFVVFLGLVKFIVSRFTTGKSGISASEKGKSLGSRMKISGLCAAPLLTVLLLSTSAFAQNHVGLLGVGSCGYATIIAAIAAASNGDTILIEEGVTFVENLGTISKSLTIRSGTIGCWGVSNLSAPLPVIDGGNVGRVASISDNVTFRRLVIRDGEITNNPGANLLVTGTGDLSIIDVTVEGAVLRESFPSITLGDHFGAEKTEGSKLE